MSRPTDLGEASRTLGFELPTEGLERLREFERLLRERAVALGLVAASDAPRIRERHILDCLRAAAIVEETDELALDVGSGAGLPGVVVAAAVPWLHVLLIEPRRARVGFLELVVERLRLANASVVPRPVEQLGQAEGPADLAFARALAPPPRAWELISPHLAPGGRLVYFAGASWDPEGLVGPTSIEVVPAPRSPVLESSGALAIMTR